ncbi:MAG: hypothetical protein H0U57_12080 [Tatlockia sp.]|nr:hypothetical protein [Tatlockia sp.]
MFFRKYLSGNFAGSGLQPPLTTVVELLFIEISPSVLLKEEIAAFILLFSPNKIIFIVFGEKFTK